MKALFCLVLYMLMTLLLSHSSQGCKNTCGEGKRIGENLRGHFTSCMHNKTKTHRQHYNWEYLVNYAVWDDVWYMAASTFYCKDKNNVDCWIEQANQFLKPTSSFLKPFKECITEYAPTNTTNSTAETEVKDTEVEADQEQACEEPENPVYVPMILKKFTSVKQCPTSKYTYISCLVSAALAVTRGAKITPKSPRFLPRYNFIELEKFVLQHRSDCRISQVSGTSSYITRCPSAPRFTLSLPKPKPSPSKPKGGSPIVIRGKRALTLAELMAQLAGGELNIRLSTSGQSRILPSGPLRTKITTPFKCFGLKLQTLLKPHSILSSAASKCNNDANTKPTSHRVSVSFRVASKPKKEPGMEGECGSNDEWTPWYNRDTPDKGAGDFEYFAWIRSRNPRDVCFRPSAVQALLAENDKPYKSAFQKVKVGPMIGLSCHNYKQTDKKCKDYKVRFCCRKI